MADSNASVPVSELISDVESRLSSPGLGASVYLPWASYAYVKVHQTLTGVNNEVAEQLFGTAQQFNLSAGTSEYSLSDNLPRFSRAIKVEVKYGGTNDDWVRAQKLPSIATWTIQNNNTTSYRPKAKPLYYLLKDVIGFIPVPPAEDTGGPVAKVWYVQRPVKITLATDIIDIPYRFQFPIVNYMQAKAIQAQNEDYSSSVRIEQVFQSELNQVVDMAASEFDETEGNFVQDADASFYDKTI